MQSLNFWLSSKLSSSFLTSPLIIVGRKSRISLSRSSRISASLPSSEEIYVSESRLWFAQVLRYRRHLPSLVALQFCIAAEMRAKRITSLTLREQINEDSSQPPSNERNTP